MAPCGPMVRKQQELVENAGDEPGGSGCLGLGCHLPHLPPCDMRGIGKDALNMSVGYVVSWGSADTSTSPFSQEESLEGYTG